MEAAMNLLSSSSPFPQRTHLRSSPPSVSVVHEQTSAILSMPSTSLGRQFPTSVFSHELRDECKQSLPIPQEDTTSQSTLERKKVVDNAFVEEHTGSSAPHLRNFIHQFSDRSDLSFLLPSLENEEHLPSATLDNPLDVKSHDVIALAKEALSASKLALSLAENPDILGAHSDGSLSPRLGDMLPEKQKRVSSTRLLERRSKKRKSSKPRIIHKTSNSERAESRKSSEGYDPNDPFRLFLWGPETKQLLTIQEENELIRKIQDLNKLIDVKRKLQSQFDREPKFSEWADAVGLSYWELSSVVHSGKRSREKLIYANFRMVVHIAKQYLGRGLILQDLLQEGSMGLMKSVEKFKPQAGCRFPSYAYWWIRQSIRKAIFQHSRTIRLPENMYSVLGKVLEAKKSYIQEGHHHPTTEELATRVGITVEKLQNLLIFMRHPLSMQQYVWTDQDTTFQEVTADTKIEKVDISVERQFMRNHIKTLLQTTLTPKEQKIINLRYGIGSASGKRSSLSEIGAIFGLSKERVRQIESRAFHKLKQSLNTHGLEAYTDLLM